MEMDLGTGRGQWTVTVTERPSLRYGVGETRTHISRSSSLQRKRAQACLRSHITHPFALEPSANFRSSPQEREFRFNSSAYNLGFSSSTLRRSRLVPNLRSLRGKSTGGGSSPEFGNTTGSSQGTFTITRSLSMSDIDRYDPVLGKSRVVPIIFSRPFVVSVPPAQEALGQSRGAERTADQEGKGKSVTEEGTDRHAGTTPLANNQPAEQESEFDHLK